MFAQHSIWLLNDRSLGALTTAMRQATAADDATRRRAAESTGSRIKRQASGSIAVLPLSGLLEGQQSFTGWLAGGTDPPAIRGVNLDDDDNDDDDDDD